MSKMQIAPLAKGDSVAVLETNFGEITIKLFPSNAPLTVENFTTHIKNGYYNGIVFHRVIKDFMIQGGDPTATGMGGESIWGSPFKDEFTPLLHNYRGALSMANAGPGTNGSQFFIVQCDNVPDSLISQMKDIGGEAFDDECIENYSSLGGTPHLDFRHTVFGQVVSGMDVVDAIASTKTGMGDKPVEDVVIQNAKTYIYEG